MSEKRPSLRWRKKPRPSGLAGMVAPDAHELRLGDVRVATASELRQGGWYWVARADELGIPLRNASGTPVATAGEAKAAAMAYVKECLSATPSQEPNP